MNVEPFTKELKRCLKSYQDNKPFVYRGVDFKTTAILATCFPLKDSISKDNIDRQIEKGVSVTEQFLLAAFQMGYDAATLAADKEKKILLDVIKISSKRDR